MSQHSNQANLSRYPKVVLVHICHLIFSDQMFYDKVVDMKHAYSHHKWLDYYLLI